jgi:hypothetical protein
VSVTQCSSCLPGYYFYSGVCYASCPAQAPIVNVVTSTCISCDSSCRSCSGTPLNCISCFGGLYLLNGNCLVSCPSGYIQNSISNSCETSNIGNTVYFPCSITFLVLLVIIIYSKYKF